MNAKEAYAWRAQIAWELRNQEGLHFANIAHVLNLSSAEKARQLVARGQRNLNRDGVEIDGDGVETVPTSHLHD